MYKYTKLIKYKYLRVQVQYRKFSLKNHSSTSTKHDYPGVCYWYFPNNHEISHCSAAQSLYIDKQVPQWVVIVHSTMSYTEGC